MPCFRFYFTDFNKKNHTFFMKLKLNKFRYPTVLGYHLGNYVFCCDCYFLFVIGLNSRFLITHYVCA